MPLNHSSSDHHMLFTSQGALHPITPEHGSSTPQLKTRTDTCVQTFILHFPCFMGPAFSSGALKSFCTGPFVPHSAISGPVLAHFSLQYTSNLLVAPKTHIFKPAFSSEFQKISAFPHKWNHSYQAYYMLFFSWAYNLWMSPLKRWKKMQYLEYLEQLSKWYHWVCFPI